MFIGIQSQRTSYLWPFPYISGASIVGDDMMPSVVNDTAVDAIILVLDDDDGSVVEELTGVMIVF